ncbi:MAG: dihydrodipicolinate synthase family protein, partial [Pirellulales bacterium]
MSDARPQKINGIVTPLITPLSDRDVLDVQGLERLIDHVLDAGVNSIFILGTSGEAPSLSYQLRREMIQRSIEFVCNRVPI